MFAWLPESDETVLGIRMSGTMFDADYQTFVPEWSARAGRTGGRVPMLFDWEGLRGWSDPAAAQDFYLRCIHRDLTDRVAIVCSARWRAEAARLAKIWSTAEVRVFDPEEKDTAWAWLRGAPERDAD